MDNAIYKVLHVVETLKNYSGKDINTRVVLVKAINANLLIPHLIFYKFDDRN